MAEACSLAWSLTGDAQWKKRVEPAGYRFVGDNDLRGRSSTTHKPGDAGTASPAQGPTRTREPSRRSPPFNKQKSTAEHPNTAIPKGPGPGMSRSPRLWLRLLAQDAAV